MSMIIRKIQASDEARWRILWEGYCLFYERELSELITTYTWQRIMDAASPVQAIVADAPGAGVVGIANYILHENTWTLTPVCYLQDLFVDADQRGEGVGEQLIEWLIEEMKTEGWARLYWNTREDNYRARGLYDKFTPHSGFLRYVVDNPPGGH